MQTTFNEHSTTADVIAGVDLHGKVALVTGASTGLGLETTRTLASAGARVIMAARPGEKLDNALAGLQKELPAARLDKVELDLTDFDSIRACAQQVSALTGKLDLLVNNAGIMAVPFARTPAGCESQFGTNHIGHFLLTNLLVPLLLHAGKARVVNLSSGGHKHCPVDFDDIHWQTREYNKWGAYGQAKTANALFTVALQKRLGDKGVSVFAVHPGAIPTELGRHLTEEDINALMNSKSFGGDKKESGGTSRGKLLFKTIPQGAATSVWAATSPDLEGKGGLYLEDCGIAAEVPVGVAEHGYFAWALDPVAAEKLWQVSGQIVGQSFSW
ncbi:MAG TPA: SDR family NAD(P)-dependent oxidoreductase [Pseudomonadales bacterium]|nr:SDR family NAD(P)-dependent oxidoreductase [Pseudomonadales bacterium]